MDKTVMVLLLAFFYCLTVIGFISLFGAHVLIPAGLLAMAGLLLINVKE